MLKNDKRNSENEKIVRRINEKTKFFPLIKPSNNE